MRSGRQKSDPVRPPRAAGGEGGASSVGLEIEFEYDDTSDGVWSPTRQAPPTRTRLGRIRPPGDLAGNPLTVHLGIALTALAVGACATFGLLADRTAANDRTIALLHLAPVTPFDVQALPTLPTLPTEPQPAEQLLATPWTDAFDRDVSLAVINDGPDPVTVLGATLTGMQFQPAALTPGGGAPTAPGDVSVLRGRAHVVCADYPAPDESATIAQLRTRAADGRIRTETLMVDRFSEITEQAVCQQVPGPQVVRAWSISPGPPRTTGTYTVTVTATNRAPFPLRMDLPQSAVQNWSSGGGLELATSDDVVIPPGGDGTIAITAKVVDCPSAVEAATNHFAYDTLAFSDGRDAADYPQARQFFQAVPVADQNSIMRYCLTQDSQP